MMQPQTKLSQLKAHAAQGNWRKAIAVAARFTQLGAYRNAILDAHMAYTNPRFLTQTGRSIEGCIAAGVDALKRAYKISDEQQQSTPGDTYDKVNAAQFAHDDTT